MAFISLKKVTILFFIFGSIVSCYAQENIRVAGYFNKKDTCQQSRKEADMFVLIKMFVADTVFQSTYINKDGSFRFNKLSPVKNFKLRYYYIQKEFTPTIQVKFQDNKAFVNVTFDLLQFRDTVKIDSKHFDSFKLYTVFGHGIVPSKFIRIAYKYGLRITQAGCVVPPGGEQGFNKETITDLNKKLGNDWFYIFWQEVEKKGY